MTPVARYGLQLAGVVRMAGGAALLARPQFIAARVAGERGGPVPARLCRLLGGRLLVQGAAEVVRPCRSTATAGAAVDLSHALSMAPAAAVWPQYRRSAALSATIAVLSAIGDSSLAGRLPARGAR